MDLTTVPTGDLQRLAETLWEERQVVEQLLYRLTCAKLLLSADEQRFVARAIDEVEDEVRRLREVELLRAGVVQGVAELAGGADRDVSLETLARDTPGPWPRVFGDLRSDFLRLAEEIEATTAANRALATQALTRVRSSIDALSGADSTSATYTAEGRTTASDERVPLHLDRVL